MVFGRGKEKAEKKSSQPKKETAQLNTKPDAASKRSMKQAQAAFLREPLSSIQQSKLVTLVAQIIELRTDKNTTVNDLQKAIPKWEKILDELKI